MEYANGLTGTDEQRQINLVDNFSWTKGSHQLKFGVDYRWQSPFTRPGVYGQFAAFSGVNSAPGGALSGAGLFADTKTLQATALLTRNLGFMVRTYGS